MLIVLNFVGISLPKLFRKVFLVGHSMQMIRLLFDYTILLPILLFIKSICFEISFPGKKRPAQQLSLHMSTLLSFHCHRQHISMGFPSNVLRGIKIRNKTLLTIPYESLSFVSSVFVVSFIASTTFLPRLTAFHAIVYLFNPFDLYYLQKSPNSNIGICD